MEWYLVCVLSSPMRGYGMISRLFFILAYERLWNDISFVFYPRLWEVMEWYLVCILSSPMRGYGIIFRLYFILAFERLWNDILFVFYPRLWKVMEWYFVCVLSSPMRGYGMISRLCFSSPMRGFGMISHMCFILAYERLWNDFSYVFDLHFFHLSNLPGPLNNGLKYLRFWLRFR